MDLSTISHRWRFAERARERLLIGLALSLLAHGFLLSLEFGIPGLGLPGLSVPWDERRATMPELSVVIVSPPPAPQPAPAPPLSTPPLPPLPPIAEATKGLKLVAPRVITPKPAPVKTKPVPTRQPKPKPVQARSQPKLIAQTEPRSDKFTVAPSDPDIPAAMTTSPVDTPDAPVVVAETPTQEPVPVKPDEPAKLDEVQTTQAQLDQKRADEEAARQAREAETKKQEEESAKRVAQERETQRQAEETAKQREAALALQKEQEAARKREQDAAAQSALELEQKRVAELKKQEQELRDKSAREAVELAARKQAEEEARRRTAELERQKQAEELARQKQAEDLAAKAREQEAVRQRAEVAAAAAAQQHERERIAEETGRAAAAAAAARQASNEGKQGGTSPLPRDLLGGGDLASRALDQVRRPDLLRIEPPRPGSREPERSQRRSVFGSLDRDVGLAMYIKSWSLKIERNGSLNYSQLSSSRARGDPVVTVAVRSDGSVEEVIINRTSGRQDLDDAVRRIVRINARFAVFPPDLARKYDVIEIRRIWSFDDTLRLVEEVR